MAYSYLQAFLQFPNAKNGSLKVYIANSTSEAVLYDPINSNPIAQPISIDSDGYAASFWAETDAFYDVEISNYLGSVVETRNNVAVIGTSAGLPGPQGEQGIQGPKGDSIAGPVGPAGTDGIDGTDGVDGVDGVSLLSIRVDETSDTGKVTYTLSSDPSNWIDAGSVMPGGIGQVKVTPVDTLGYLNTKVIAGTGISIVGSTELIVTLDPTITSDIAKLKDDVIDLDARVDVLESASVSKQVLYGGGVGDTNVVIHHSLATSNLSVTCYNTVDNSVVFLGVIVSDTQVSISGLSPLIATNQIKIVLIR